MTDVFSCGQKIISNDLKIMGKGMSYNEIDLFNIVNNLDQMGDMTFKRILPNQRSTNTGKPKNYKNHCEFSKILHPIIHAFEVILRKKIDNVLSRSNPNHPYWVMTLYFYNAKVLKDKNQQNTILKAQKNIEDAIEQLPHPKKYPTISVFWNNCQYKKTFHDILVSHLNLGFWIIILQNNIFFSNTHNTNVDFAQYLFPKLKEKIQKNQSEFFNFLSKQKQSSQKINKTTSSEKTILLVSFLSSIRRRLNHCESFLKPNNKKSNITTKLYDIEIYFDCRKNKIIKLLTTILEDFL